MASEFYNGKRLSFDGQLCTVRYHGEVKGTKGEWLGVEWDDPTRGKHSGEHGGIRYFECLSNQPTAGSFIRPNRKPDPPRSFVEALKAKYASEEFKDPDVEIVFATEKGSREIIHFNPTSNTRKNVRISGKEVEEVGFDKIRRKLAALSELKIVILDGLCMERPAARKRDGVDGWPEGLTDVKDACPKTIELDLSRNLFEEWREVASICEQLERLQSLRVDGTRFRDTNLSPTEIARCRTAFSGIKTLKLESTLLPWSSLTNLTHLFPDLTALIASQNLYPTLPPLYIPTSTLTDLSLEENLLTDLASLHPLTNLPHLRRLILKSNNISTTSNTPNTLLPVFPPSLADVDLSYNEISTWSFISALPTIFPSLTSLRISHNPLFATLRTPAGRTLTPEDGYMLVLARLGSLKTLNFSPVLPKERLNAESYYLSLIAQELSFAPEADADKILATHPRWKELCEEYGEPVVERREGQVNPNSLAARLVSLRVHGNVLDETRETVLEIPKSASAYTLLGVVAREFNLQPRVCRLVWETGDWMPAAATIDGGDGEDDAWNSGSESDEERERARLDRVMREVEIVPGTRSVGTWIEGNEATLRLEVKQ